MKILFSLIIPTYNRSKDLTECIESVFSQDVLPNEIILIDDAQTDKLFLEKIRSEAEKKEIKLIYHKKNHTEELRGTATSKNIGLRKASNEIVVFLDNDAVLYPGALRELMEIWQRNRQDPRLLGVGGVAPGARKKRTGERIFNFIFGLSGQCAWDVNSAGFQVWDDFISWPAKGYYLLGCFCSLNRTKALKIGGFPEFCEGHVPLEETDFFMRAKRLGYHCIINPRAKFFHKNSSGEHPFLTGLKESRNRKLIFMRNCKKSFPSQINFYRANAGWISRQFLAGNFSKTRGMIIGLFL